MAAKKRNSAGVKLTRRARESAHRSGMTKTAFVLSMDRSTPAAEVIAAAAENGMRLSAKHVYKIRSANRSKLEGNGAVYRDQGGPPTPANFRTASAYIKAQPLDMPTPEVIAAGRAHGFEINRHLIYVTRAAMRKKLALGQPLARPAAGGHIFSSTVGNSFESQFRTLVIELGIRRARALVADIEQRLQTLIVAG